jgi:hypothetical protein
MRSNDSVAEINDHGQNTGRAQSEREDVKPHQRRKGGQAQSHMTYGQCAMTTMVSGSGLSTVASGGAGALLADYGTVQLPVVST